MTISMDGCCIGDAACHCSKTEAFQDDFNYCVVMQCPARKDQMGELCLRSTPSLCSAGQLNPLA